MIFEDQNIFRERNLRDILNMMWGAHTQQAKQTKSPPHSVATPTRQNTKTPLQIAKQQEEAKMNDKKDDDHIGYIHQIGYCVAFDVEETPLQISKEQEKKKMNDKKDDDDIGYIHQIGLRVAF